LQNRAVTVTVSLDVRETVRVRLFEAAAIQTQSTGRSVAFDGFVRTAAITAPAATRQADDDRPYRGGAIALRGAGVVVGFFEEPYLR
jgi:hypothetical protein